MWAIMVSFLSAAIAIMSAWYAARCRRAVRDVAAALESSQREPRSLALRVESLTASLQDQGETLKQLANKVKMQRVRTAINHVGDETSTGADLKTQLRMKAGLIAGQPAPHK